MAPHGRLARAGVAGLALVAGLVVGACGGGSDESGPKPATTAGKSVAEAPSKTVTAPPRTGPTPTTQTLTTPTETTPRGRTTTAPEGGSGGGGDEGGNHIPVALTVKAGGTVTPPTVSVPAFFRLAVTVRNRDSRAHDVTVTGPRVRNELRHVAPGTRASVEFQGGKPATFRVLIDGRRRARIVTGAQPGP